MNSPRIGEKWTVGTCTNLIYVGVGRDLSEAKYLIFSRTGPTPYLIIPKDEFYSVDLHKERQQ